jgi:N-methylhydantoinase B
LTVCTASPGVWKVAARQRGNGIAMRTPGRVGRPTPNAKIFNVRLERGDAYKMLSGGGGGFGNPLQRDPAKVADDVREGYVSTQAALKLYGVVLDETCQVMQADTQALRSNV